MPRRRSRPRVGRWCGYQYWCGYRPHRQTVYLAGSISGHSSWDVPAGWRARAAEALRPAGYTVLDPMRGRTPEDRDFKDIVRRDLADIDRADILLVEMDHGGLPYIGTAMEIRYAWERKKEIILWGSANQQSHWLRYHAPVRLESLDAALSYLLRARVRPACSPAGSASCQVSRDDRG